MKLGLINSAWVQANQPTEYGLRKTKELGFDSIDIFADPLDLARAALMVSNFWAASVMALPFSVEGFDVRDFTAFVGSLLLSRFPATV